MLRRRLGSSQVEALHCFQNPHHQVFYAPVYCAARLGSPQVELPQTAVTHFENTRGLCLAWWILLYEWLVAKPFATNAHKNNKSKILFFIHICFLSLRKWSKLCLLFRLKHSQAPHIYMLVVRGKTSFEEIFRIRQDLIMSAVMNVIGAFILISSLQRSR